MPVLTVLGTAAIAGGILAFNPLGFLIQNPLILGLATMVVGIAMLMFSGKRKGGLGTALKFIGGAFTIAGVVPLITSLLSGVFGGAGVRAAL